MAWSFKIGSAEFLVKRSPKPRIIPAIDWVTSWAENRHGSDCGAAQDVYETELTFYDTETVINTLQTNLNAVREDAVFSSFTDEIFAPNVDHTSPIDCTLTVLKPRRSLSFVAGGSKMWEMVVIVRALAPALLSTTPSLASLRPQYGAEADKSYDSVKGFTYDGDAVYADRRTDVGTYTGPFLQTTAEIKAILAYILITARAAAITFPSGIGETYPFGVVRGALPKSCKITAFTFSRRDQEMWNITITFSEQA